MKNLFFVFVLILGSTCVSVAQELMPASPLGMVKGDRSKIFYDGNETIYFHINVEGKGWKTYRMRKGVYYIHLKNCGKGPKKLCDKQVKVSFSQNGPYCTDLKLKAGKRYRIEPVARSRNYQIKLLSE